jgi:hypothetical protein
MWSKYEAQIFNHHSIFWATYWKPNIRIWLLVPLHFGWLKLSKITLFPNFWNFEIHFLDEISPGKKPRFLWNNHRIRLILPRNVTSPIGHAIIP